MGHVGCGERGWGGGVGGTSHDVETNLHRVSWVQLVTRVEVNYYKLNRKKKKNTLLSDKASISIYLGNFLLKTPIEMLLASGLCLLPGLIYNACQLELVGIFVRKCKQASTF